MVFTGLVCAFRWIRLIDLEVSKLGDGAAWQCDLVIDGYAVMY